jgi:hypothetical protein
VAKLDRLTPPNELLMGMKTLTRFEETVIPFPGPVTVPEDPDFTFSITSAKVRLVCCVPEGKATVRIKPCALDIRLVPTE